MNLELLEEARVLWEKGEKIDKFGSKFREYPLKEATAVYEGTSRLIEQIPETSFPQSTDELYEGELRRNLISTVIGLEHFLRGTPYTLDDIIRLYGIEEEDLAEIKPWLVANKQQTIEAIERLFVSTDVVSYELALPIDIPRIRNQAEGFAGTQITNYHQKLGSLFEGKTAAGTYLHRITSEPSTTERSYFNPLTGRLGLSMTAICYEVEDGTIQLRERELLRLFGHEGMGHGLLQVITNASNLPFFLKKRSAAATATEEAITQHYERAIFEDLKQSPKTQKDLRIADRFDEIYQEELDTRQITDFNRNLLFYGILVLADKTLGKPDDPDAVRKRLDLISEVALNPGTARSFVEFYRRKYDLEDNLDLEVTGELRYASRVVKRAFDIFQSHGISYDNNEQRSQIDLTFLTGYYTPVGFVQKTELACANHQT